MTSDAATRDRWTFRFRRAAASASVAVILIGAVVVVGWIFDLPALKQVHPGFVTMKANTALLFVILGAGLWLSRDDSRARARRICGVVVATLGALTLAEYLLRVNLGIDELFFRELPAPRYPGRMSPLTAMTFVVLGAALLVAHRDRLLRAAQLAVLLVATAALMAFCGYLYGASPLYAIGLSSAIAFHTTLAFLVACGAFLLARPQEGVMKVVSGDTAAGQLLRRLLPVFVLAPIVIGWLRLHGQVRGYYDTAFGVALFALSSVVLVTTFTWWFALRLERSEHGLHRALEEITTLNANLERRVDARTKELALAKDRLDGIITLAADAIISFDDHQRITIFNKGAEEIFGWARDEVIGRPLDLLLPDRFRSVHHHHMASFAAEATVARRISERRRVFGVRKNGQEFPAEAAISKLEVDGRHIFTVILRDISARVRFEEELRESEDRFRLTIEEAPIGMALVALDGRFVRVNRSLCEIVGYSAEELTTRTFQDITHPDDLEKDLALAEKLARGDVPRYQLEKRYVRKDGTTVDVMLSGSILRRDGTPLYYIAQIEDITERKRADAALRISEESLSLAVEASGQGLWDWNLVTDEAHLSPRYWAMVGRTEGEHHPNFAFFKSIIHPEDLPAVENTMREHLEGRSAQAVIEYRVTREDGDEVWLRGIGRVMARDSAGHPLRMAGVIADVTRERRLQDDGAKVLREKETLLKEIHHRVKNNLQILSSLFYLQRQRTDQESLRTLLDESRNRVQSIALIHEKLYQSENFARIDFDDYLNDLTRGLTGAIGARSPQVTIAVHAEGVFLDIERAIPCALIVNELVSNSLKHAFPGGERGEIHVEAAWVAPGVLRLAVSDTGVGFPAELDFENTRTLGMQLVCSLTTQLKGTVSLGREHGTRFEIRFPFGPRPVPHRDSAAAHP